VSDQGYGQGQPYQGQTQGAGYPGQGYQGQGQGYPAGQGYGSAPAPNGSGTKGFLASLFDVSFTSFVTPTIIKVVYILVMILAGLGALGFVFEAFFISAIFGIIVLVIIAPIIYLFELALWRISLEIFMVIFRMSDDIHAIRNGGGGLR
jgi:hypothetical protein